MIPLPVVPVVDLRGGLVVRGKAGNRAAYQPMESRLVPGCDPCEMAAALAAATNAEFLYVADLDAIEHDRPQWAAITAVAASGAQLWLDAGVGTPCQLGRLEVFLKRQKIDAQIVLGLESLASVADLEELLQRLEPERLIFSIDLHGGRLLTQVAEWSALAPAELVRNLFARGVRRFVLLDLAAVGMHSGVPTLNLAATIRREIPAADLQLIGGGGVRTKADLQAMSDAGFDFALVASALHDGTLLREE